MNSGRGGIGIRKLWEGLQTQCDTLLSVYIHYIHPRSEKLNHRDRVSGGSKLPQSDDAQTTHQTPNRRQICMGRRFKQYPVHRDFEQVKPSPRVREFYVVISREHICGGASGYPSFADKFSQLRFFHSGGPRKTLFVIHKIIPRWRIVLSDGSRVAFPEIACDRMAFLRPELGTYDS